jgi:3-deoxy-D-manno-octulosonic-acid transferase
VNLEKALKGITCRYTDSSTTKNVMILNTIGHLSSAYYAGKIAYIGGGFSGKLHNILEPAVFGLPIIIGPKYDKFPEAIEFINRGVGFSVKNKIEFELVLDGIEKKSTELSKKILDLVDESKGASDKILNHLVFNF